MRSFEIEKKLHVHLKKLSKKDKNKYNILWKKINEIINIADIEHYKNLRFPMNNFKRVHIGKSFVLIFKYDKTTNKVLFYNLENHDKIYKK